MQQALQQLEGGVYQFSFVHLVTYFENCNLIRLFLYHLTSAV
jgi:hypothetical protein